MSLTEHQFVSILKQNIRPAQPIDSPELLQGRELILRDIGRTLHSPGMHVFIHGERGIGKTSIALTAAKSFMQADPPYVGCDERSTFDGLVGDICAALLDQTYLSSGKDVKGTAGVNVGLFKVEGTLGGSGRVSMPSKIASVNHAANLIRESAESRAPSEPIIIIDEIDRIASHDVKSQLAEVIKVMHDMRVPIRMVMCGIGKTLDEIIGSHLSASRAITGFELPRDIIRCTLGHCDQCGHQAGFRGRPRLPHPAEPDQRRLPLLRPPGCREPVLGNLRPPPNEHQGDLGGLP